MGTDNQPLTGTAVFMDSVGPSTAYVRRLPNRRWTISAEAGGQIYAKNLPYVFDAYWRPKKSTEERKVSPRDLPSDVPSAPANDRSCALLVWAHEWPLRFPRCRRPQCKQSFDWTLYWHFFLLELERRAEYSGVVLLAPDVSSSHSSRQAGVTSLYQYAALLARRTRLMLESLLPPIPEPQPNEAFESRAAFPAHLAELLPSPIDDEVFEIPVPSHLLDRWSKEVGDENLRTSRGSTSRSGPSPSGNRNPSMNSGLHCATSRSSASSVPGSSFDSEKFSEAVRGKRKTSTPKTVSALPPGAATGGGEDPGPLFPTHALEVAGDTADLRASSDFSSFLLQHGRKSLRKQTKKKRAFSAFKGRTVDHAAAAPAGSTSDSALLSDSSVENIVDKDEQEEIGKLVSGLDCNQVDLYMLARGAGGLALRLMAASPGDVLWANPSQEKMSSWQKEVLKLHTWLSDKIIGAHNASPRTPASAVTGRGRGSGWGTVAAVDSNFWKGDVTCMSPQSTMDSEDPTNQRSGSVHFSSSSRTKCERSAFREKIPETKKKEDTETEEEPAFDEFATRTAAGHRGVRLQSVVFEQTPLAGEDSRNRQRQFPRRATQSTSGLLPLKTKWKISATLEALRLSAPLRGMLFSPSSLNRVLLHLDQSRMLCRLAQEEKHKYAVTNENKGSLLALFDAVFYYGRAYPSCPAAAATKLGIMYPLFEHASPAHKASPSDHSGARIVEVAISNVKPPYRFPPATSGTRFKEARWRIERAERSTKTVPYIFPVATQDTGSTVTEHVAEKRRTSIPSMAGKATLSVSTSAQQEDIRQKIDLFSETPQDISTGETESESIENDTQRERAMRQGAWRRQGDIERSFFGGARHVPVEGQIPAGKRTSLRVASAGAASAAEGKGQSWTETGYQADAESCNSEEKDSVAVNRGGQHRGPAVGEEIRQVQSRIPSPQGVKLMLFHSDICRITPRKNLYEVTVSLLEAVNFTQKPKPYNPVRYGVWESDRRHAQSERTSSQFSAFLNDEREPGRRQADVPPSTAGLTAEREAVLSHMSVKALQQSTP